MKSCLLLLFVFVLDFGALAQDFRKNEVFVELLGNGMLGSINYERQLMKNPGFGVRAGVGIYGTDARLTIPMGVNYLIRVIKNHSFLDLGMGATFTQTDGFFYSMPKLPAGYVKKENYMYLIPSAGLRAYTTRNYIWRIGASVFITDSGALPWLGIGFGKRF